MPGPRRPPSPLAVLVLLGTLILVPTLLYAVRVKSFTVWPDELTYVKEASEIARKHAPLTSGDPYFNSWSQLLPLLMAPGYALLSAPGALALAHGIAAVALVSTLVPTYLLARSVGLPVRDSYVVAALVTVGAWLSFAGTVMTESLALPAFVWALLACHRAMTAPSVRADLLALVAIGVAVAARAQLVVLLPALLFAIILLALRRRTPWRGLARMHRLFAAGIGLAVIAVAASTITGSLSTLGGNYGGAVSDVSPSLADVRAGIDNLIYVVFASGVVPLVVGTAWAWRSLADNDDVRAAATGALQLSLTACLVLQVAAFGGSFLSGTTTVTGRYLFYLAVLGYVGTVAWARRPGGWRTLGAVTAVFAAAAALANAAALGTAVDAPSQERAAAPTLGERVVDALDGFGHLFLPVLVVAAVGLLVVLVRRLAPTRAMAVIATALLAFGAGAAAYRARGIARVANAHPASSPRDWVDRVLGSETAVVIPGTTEHDPLTEDRWRELLFANVSVQRALVLPGPSLLNSVGGNAFLDLRRGRIVIPTTNTDAARAAVDEEFARPLTDVADIVVVAAGDPRFAPRGKPLATKDGIRVVRLRDGAGLKWAVNGADVDGHVPQRSNLTVFSRGSGARAAVLTVRADPQAPCPCVVRAGGRIARLPGPRASARLVTPLQRRARGRETIELRFPPGVRIVGVALRTAGYPDASRRGAQLRNFSAGPAS
ncbi:MAG: hypothetical protein E6G10_22690 [Actinobacteria bacterium]|nr:MAG: hypothetical protein E6G10_22690 [Actinomycetota bacterium]